MAINKNISVTLTLNDAGFGVKGKAARDVIELLGKSIGTAAGQSMKLEEALAGLNKPLNQQTQMLKAIGVNAELLTHGLADLIAEVKGLSGQMDKMVSAASVAGNAIKGIGTASKQANVELSSLKPSLAQVEQGMTSMGKASKNATASMQADSNQRKKMAIDETQAQIAADKERLASRERTYQQMRELALKTQREIEMERARVGQANIAKYGPFAGGKANERMGIDPVTGAGTYSNDTIRALEKQLSLLSQQAEKQAQGNAQMREGLRLHQETVGKMEQELRASESIAAYIARKNAQQVGMARQQEYERAVLEQRTDEARLRRIKDQQNAQRAAHQEAMSQAEAMKGVLKSMAMMYAGARIEQGLKASVGASNDYSRTQERLETMRLDGPAGNARLRAIAKSVEQDNPNFSPTQAMQLTLAGAAGTISTDEKILKPVVNSIAQMITVLKRQFPEEGHNIENMGRNVMGTMEARGITQDAQAMKDYINSLFKAMILTQGKITLPDFETLMRQGGAGNATLKDNEAVFYDIAAASQLKVMGGSAGGGGGGVSKFATMQQQLAKRAQGGTRETIQGVNQLVEFGVIDSEEFKKANNGIDVKDVKRNYRTVPYVGSDLAALNPTKWGIEMAAAVMEKLKALPESDTRFFRKGENRNDPNTLQRAFGTFADQSFGNKNVAEMMKLLSNPSVVERIEREVEAAKQAMDMTEAHKKAMDSWELSVDKMHAAIVRLGIAIGDQLIPVLQPIVDGITSFTTSLSKFAEENPALTAIAAIAGGIGGLILTIGGFLSMFGKVGKLLRAVATIAGLEAAPAVAGVGSAFTLMGGAAMAVGGVIGLAIGSWVKDIRIGGITIQQDVENSFNAIGQHWKNTIEAMSIDWSRFVRYLENRRLDLKGIFTDVSKEREALNSSLNAKIAAGQQAIAKNNAVAAMTANQPTQKPIIGGGDGQRMDASKDPRSSLFGKAIPSIAEQTINKTGPRRFTRAKVEEMYGPDDGSGEQDGTSADTGDAGTGGKNGPRGGRNGKRGNRKTGTGGTAGANGASSEVKPVRPPRIEHEAVDKLHEAAMYATGDLEALQERFKDMVANPNDTAEGTMKAIAAKLEGQRQGGKFDTIKEGQRIRPSAEDPEFTAMVKERQEAALLNEQVKMLTYSHERLNATESDAAEAMERLGPNAAQESAALRALERDFARLEARMRDIDKQNPFYQAEKQMALFNRRIADSVNFFADLGMKNKEAAAALLPTELERQMAKLNADQSEMRDKMALNINGIKEQADLAIAAQHRLTAATMAGSDARVEAERYEAEQVLKITTRRDAALNAALAAQAERERIMALERERALETPVTKMAREWQDVQGQMRTASASWMDGFVNMLVDGIGKGKLQFKEFATSVLTDIARISIKKNLAEPLSNIINQGAASLTSWISGVKPIKEDKSALPTGDFARMDRAADKASESLTKMVDDGVADATAGLIKDGATSTAVSNSFATVVASMTPLPPAMTAAANAAYAFAAAAGGSGGGGLLGGLFGGGGGVNLNGAASSDGVDLMSLFYSANGNIIGGDGAMQLRKYAKGGIAKKPQVSVFGEGDMPEAYVPLPDGRAIPVNMNGGGAPEVHVNVINQTSQPVSAQQGQMRFDGKQMILDVVLTGINQPGPFRDGVKNAVRS